MEKLQCFKILSEGKILGRKNYKKISTKFIPHSQCNLLILVI